MATGIFALLQELVIGLFVGLILVAIFELIAKVKKPTSQAS